MARKRPGLLPALIMVIALLTGCGADRTAREEADTITVYLWTSAMLERFAPYIQAQLPDVNIQFVVGNNDLDFYRFMDEHGALPDIITCCRFSLHDAAPLNPSRLHQLKKRFERSGITVDGSILHFGRPHSFNHLIERTLE